MVPAFWAPTNKTLGRRNRSIDDDDNDNDDDGNNNVLVVAAVVVVAVLAFQVAALKSGGNGGGGCNSEPKGGECRDDTVDAVVAEVRLLSWFGKEEEDTQSLLLGDC